MTELLIIGLQLFITGIVAWVFSLLWSAEHYFWAALVVWPLIGCIVYDLQLILAFIFSIAAKQE